MVSKKIKVSTIGVGHLGAIHCKLLAENNEIEFAGVYDKSEQHCIKIADQYKVNCFSKLEDAINYSDALIIAAPTIHNKEIATEVIKNGKHCFIEKPVCSNSKEANDLLQLAKNYNKVKIQIGHIERFNPAILEAKKYNLNPLFIEAHRLSQFKPRSTDVSVVYDLMIHDIDLVLWLTNSDIKQISANGVSVITDTIDVANARIEFENGMVANLTASRLSAKSMRKFRIFQNDGYYSLDFAKGELELFRIIDNNTSSIKKENIIPTQLLGDLPKLKDKSIIYEMPEVNKINAMAEEQNIFFGSILENNEVGCSLADGIKALQVADKINEMIMQN